MPRKYNLTKPPRTHSEYHGGSGTTEYRSWSGMLKRCYDPADPKYPDYGGRGIVVCERWRNSFKNFREDMGLKPSKDHSLDRINNSGPYELKNCRWATRTEQARNRRGVKRFKFRGKSMTIIEFLEEIGCDIPARVVYARVFRKGWPLDKAIKTPVMQMGEWQKMPRGPYKKRKALK